MKNIVLLALLGRISAIELKQLHRSGFWPAEFETMDEGDGLPAQEPTFSFAQARSDPITGSLGQPVALIPEIDVDAVVQNDLRTRSPVNFNPSLDTGVTSTTQSLKWAEKALGKKLSEPSDAKQSMSDAYDPTEAPQYTLPADMMEDEETASTLKSAHLAEWIHKNGGVAEQHHHHDPYHLDENGKATAYKRPGGGYEGVGFHHEGKNEQGFYGSANSGATCVATYTHVQGCVLGGNIQTFKRQTLDTCKAKCDGIATCKGFEFYVKQETPPDQPNSGVWEEGDCTPQSDDNTDNCPYQHHQLNFWRKNPDTCQYGGRFFDSSKLIGLHRKGEQQAGPIRQWWNKIEKDQFDGMSTRKEYNQVARDLIEANKDASPKLIATAVLRREMEHQAKQYALYKGVGSDAREVGNALRGFTIENEEPDAGETERKDKQKTAEDVKKETDALAEKKMKEAEVEKLLQEEKFQESQAVKKAADEEQFLKKGVAEVLNAKKAEHEAEKAEMAKASAEKAVASENEKKLEEAMKAQAAEDKKAEDKVVSAQLEAEGNAFGAKLVEESKKKASDAARQKDTAGVVDPIDVATAGIIGDEAARKLAEPIDPPKKESAVESKAAFVPPELDGMLSLSQKASKDPKSAAFTFGDDDETELNRVSLNGVTDIRFPEDENNILMLDSQSKLERVMRFEETQ